MCCFPKLCSGPQPGEGAWGRLSAPTCVCVCEATPDTPSVMPEQLGLRCMSPAAPTVRLYLWLTLFAHPTCTY